MAPVVALREPDDLVRCRQIAPVDAAVARLEERLGLLFQHLADRAGRGIRHAQLLVPVIARRGHERHRRCRRGSIARRPTRRGTPRRRTASSGAGRAASASARRAAHRHVDVDDHAVDHRHDGVAGQRILPRLQLRDGRPWCPRDTSRRRCADPAETSRSSSSPATTRGSDGRCASSRRCRWRSRNP